MVFGSFAAIIVAIGLFRAVCVWRLQRWRKIDATLVRREVRELTVYRVGSPAKFYTPEVEYEFQHSGRTFRSRRFSVHNFTMGFPEEIDEILSGAKVGDRLTVFFDPSDPERSLVKLPDYTSALMLLFVGAVVGIFVILIAYGRP